jgi:PAS domain S-box-containing protein
MKKPHHSHYDSTLRSALVAKAIGLLFIVFFAELVADQIIPRIIPYSSALVAVIADSVIIILFSAPFIWLLVFRPLHSSALFTRVQFEHIFAQMVDAVIILDDQNIIASCNQAVESIFGVPSDDFLGKFINEVIDFPTDYSMSTGYSGEGADTGDATLQMSCYGTHSCGKKIPLSVSVSVARFNSRKVTVLIIRDMTQARVAEQKLQQSLSLLEATLQSTADGILAVSWDREIQVYNRQFVELFGIPEEILENMTYETMRTHLDRLTVDPSEISARLDVLYKDHTNSSYDVLQLKDGRCIERYSQPQSLNGSGIGRVWSYRDITARIHSEQELKKREMRFRNLADNAPVGIFETDAKGDCIFVNKKWCQIAGIEADKALGKGWTSALHTVDVGLIETEWYRSVDNEVPFRCEYRFRTPEGAITWVLGSASALRGDDGSNSGYMGIIIDINERKKAERELLESEERFRMLFEQSEDAIVLFSPGMCGIVDVNATTEKLYGYSRSELVDLAFNVFKSDADYHRFINSVCMLNDTETCQLDHIVNLRSDGSEIHVSVRAKVIKLQGQDTVFCTLRDITQRLRMEDEARSIQSQLIHTNKMTSLGLLVAGIAHEINNPNNYIMANAQMIDKILQDLEPLLKAEAKAHGDFVLGGLPYSSLETALPEMISAINDGSRRIKKIIGGLKNYSRQGYDAEELIDLNQVVSSSMLLLQHHVNKYTENFVIQLEKAIPAVRGNAQQLEQVAINLIMNALQSLTEKRQGLSVTTSYSSADQQVCLKIADEGCGIPDGVLERIMEPFFTTRLDSGGTGLGLSISRSIVLAHHGDIEITSRPGHGTTVSVYLPAVSN